MTSAENGVSPKFDHNPLPNGKEDTSSDSDDSMKSDVPLKKYVQETSKYGGESSKATVSNVENINDDVKENEKEDKNKKSLENNNDENITNDAHTEEELRSEQFMESFGFFSERKPRKSNLLATKKISETFHIISNESDDIFLPAKNKSTKKPNSTESNKKGKEPDPGNGKILKEKNKKTLDPSISKKPQKKRRRRRRPINSATYCLFCRKDFERLDNYLRHKITLLHISRVSEIQMRFTTKPFADLPNHLVAYKHHIYKLKKKREKMARDKKKSGRDSPIEPFVFPTLAEIINKPGTSKSKANKGKSSKGKGKKSEIKRSKSKKSEVSAIEANKSENKEVNEEETAKLEIKEHEGFQLETDKPGCSSENISRRGLSRDEALFLDCCELLKESHKAENLNTETSHALEEGNESFEVKSFDGASILNNDEKSWGKNEDDIDPITAKSILESEEVRNLEKDLISGLKEAVSNASSLVSNAKASKEFASDIKDTNEILHFSKKTDIYLKEKNIENECYSKKVEIIYSNKEMNEIPHCSKDIEAIYSNEKINENAHCSKKYKNYTFKRKN
ncbi:hypothetical protein EVAR_68042_1 [Eumeta japonica]|uniref:C2H2-type domain-containing protein n=1 Tax=Eumeta variegata TaxID=151549 RepID=A0A4C1ZVR2_EUMVA|nr:hypothetical protein EVAR_68042_1 [Eumeta japonica]